jgi:hypothetical protein
MFVVLFQSSKRFKFSVREHSQREKEVSEGKFERLRRRVSNNKH